MVPTLAGLEFDTPHGPLSVVLAAKKEDQPAAIKPRGHGSYRQVD